MKNRLRTFTPPPELDAAIRSAAHREAVARKLRRIHRGILAFATAAAACVCVGVFCFHCARVNEPAARDAEYLAHWDTNSLENEVYDLELSLDGARNVLVSIN